MEEKDTNTQLIKTLFKNRFKILLTAILFSVVAFGVTFFIPKKYTSTGLVYPTNSNSMKDVANNSYFGFDFQADRLIQLFESQKMKEKVVKRYNLMDYYEIDSSSKNWRYNLNKNYNEDITFKRTKFISVKVSTVMEDPELASNITNYMIGYIDTIRKDILYENLYLMETDLKKKVDNQQLTVDSLLRILSQGGAKVKPNELALNLISKLEENKANGKIGLGDEIVKKAAKENYSFTTAKSINEYYHQSEILFQLKKELVKLQEKLSLPFPKVYKVQSAHPDYKKTSPSYSINIILGFLVGLLGSVFYFSLQVRLKKLADIVKND